MIPVKAKIQGYYIQLREPGEEFQVASESDLGSWMKRLDGKPNPAEKRIKAPRAHRMPEPDKVPETLSEAAKADLRQDIPLAQMDADQLLAYAKVNGIKVHPFTKKPETILARIREAESGKK